LVDSAFRYQNKLTSYDFDIKLDLVYQIPPEKLDSKIDMKLYEKEVMLRHV